MNRVEDYIGLPYTTLVTPDEDIDGTPCYRAEHPQLPGCMSHGATQEEAITNLAEARRLYIETCLELGRDIPIPAVSTIQTYSSDSSFMTIFYPAVKLDSTLPSVVDMAKQAA